MKLLRILTGVHAGAQLQLNAIALRVGADHEADIRISDWPSASMTLTFDSQGTVILEPITPNEDELAKAVEQTTAETEENANANTETETEPKTQTETETEASAAGDDLRAENSMITLTDFMPVKFGDIVLCVGDEGASWPSDVELLSQLLAPPKAEMPVQAKPHRQRMVTYAVSAILVLTVFATAALWSERHAAQAAQAASINTLAEQVAQALASARLKGLRVVLRGNTVVISGMVATPSEDIAVRQMISRVDHPNTIMREYDVATNIAQDITESLGIPGVNVQYVGAGVFQVLGTVPDLSHAQQALKRLNPDFTSNVKRIESMLIEAPAASQDPTYSGLMSSDSVKYFETPDGVKHIYPSSPSNPSNLNNLNNVGGTNVRSTATR